MNHKACAKCRFVAYDSKAIKSHQWECRFNAPIDDFRFPLVNPTDWCGGFEVDLNVEECDYATE